MTSDMPPPAPRESRLLTARIRQHVGLVSGVAVGFLLWLIIGVVTNSLLLGVLFGLTPGVAIGLGLQLTAKR